MELPTSQKQAFWYRPISLLQTRREKWFFILFFTLFIPLFLLVFQPFGVNNYDPTHKIGWVFFLASFGFGMVCGITLAIYEFLVVPYVFKRSTLFFFITRISFGMLLVSSSIFLFYNIMGNFHDWSFASFLGFIRDVSSMAIVPLGIILLYFAYRRTYEAYQDLKIQPLPKLREKLIWLEEDNTRKQIAIKLDALLYIEAQDNYVAVHHLENGEVRKTLLRTTMKKLESQLELMHVVRCHRSYMINLTCVEKVSRSTAYQFRLYLPKITAPIPVSRSYISVLDVILDVHHK